MLPLDTEAGTSALLPGTEVDQSPAQMMSAGAEGKKELDRLAGKKKGIPGCKLRGPVDLNCSILRECTSGFGCWIYRLWGLPWWEWGEVSILESQCPGCIGRVAIGAGDSRT